MMESQYIDPGTDEVFQSCYEAIHGMYNEILFDEDGDKLDKPKFSSICEAPEMTTETDTKGRWLVPYKGSPHDLLKQMVLFWQRSNPTKTGTGPSLNAQRKSRSNKLIQRFSRVTSQ